MLEKQRQFWNLHQIPHKTTKSIFDFIIIIIIIIIVSKNMLFCPLTCNFKNLGLKIENRFV